MARVVMLCCRRSDGRYLITQRSDRCGSYVHEWVFPGGRAETHEGLRTALRREIREELAVTCLVDIELCQFEKGDCKVHVISGKLHDLPRCTDEVEGICWATVEDLHRMLGGAVADECLRVVRDHEDALRRALSHDTRNLV